MPDLSVEEDNKRQTNVMSTNIRKLSDRQERFIVEYLGCANAAEAARRAGYSENTAKQMGYENLTKPYLKQAIEAKRNEIMSDSEDKVAWLMERLTAEATAADNGEATRVRALEVIGKVIGAYAPEKVEQTTFSGGFLADVDLEEPEIPDHPAFNPLDSEDLH